MFERRSRINLIVIHVMFQDRRCLSVEMKYSESVEFSDISANSGDTVRKDPPQYLLHGQDEEAPLVRPHHLARSRVLTHRRPGRSLPLTGSRHMQLLNDTR